MKALAIDTSSNKSFLALFENETVLAYQMLPSGRDLSKDLFPALISLLESCNTTLKDISYIAAGIGPGSYTGTRSGVCAAKSLAFGLQIPFFSFCSLFAYHTEEKEKFAITFSSKGSHFFVVTAEKKENRWHYHLQENIDKENLNSILNRFSFVLSDPHENPSLAPNYSFLAKLLYHQYLSSQTTPCNNLEIIYLHTKSLKSSQQDFIFDC